MDWDDYFRQQAVMYAHFGDCERRFHTMVSAHFI